VSGSPPGTIRRFRAAGLDSALEQFARPELLRAGKVNIIALDAVVERLGKRWASRSEHVHRHVQTVLDRQLGLQGFSLRVSDTDYLVCQPQLGRLTAQASCIRLLREILRHFLGEIDLPEVDVHEVSRISAEGVDARRVDEREALAAGADEGAAEPEGGGPTKGEPSRAGSLVGGATLTYSNGRRVHLQGRLSEVIDLRGRCVIGLRISKRVIFEDTSTELSSSELALWPGADRLELNVSAIEAGLRLLDARNDQVKPQALIVPVAVSSLLTAAGRTRVVGILKAARARAVQGVICELRHVEGVPAGTLVAATSVVRPFALLVIANVESVVDAATGPLRTARLNGVSLECPPTLDEAALVAWTKAAVVIAKRIAKSVLLLELPREMDASLIEEAGVTHTAFADPRK
jgi:hypothetical protein